MVTWIHLTGSVKKLPTEDDFYDEHISDTQNLQAIEVWNTFNLKNMGEYHDLYLKSDVFLLADIFENCRNYYKLDPCHYYTSPGLFGDVMLKTTDIKSELIIDVDMFQFRALHSQSLWYGKQ